MASDYSSIPHSNTTLQPHSFKIILIGNANVGKTSLILRYADGYFQDTSNHKVLYSDYIEKFVVINQTPYKFIIWDTAGQEKYRSVTRSLYRNVDGIMFVYDVTSQSSYSELKSWVKEVRDSIDIFDAEICFFLANKSDIEGKNQKVPFNSLQSDPDFSEFEYKFKTSALTGENVNFAFEKLAHEIVKRSSPRDVQEEFKHILQKYDSEEPTGCAC